jgi:hypothetical protein
LDPVDPAGQVGVAVNLETDQAVFRDRPQMLFRHASEFTHLAAAQHSDL